MPRYFDIAGGPFGEKNYLVLFQNNNELRPTGGFISAYGTLRFRNGFFAGLEINDVFGEIANHEYVEPPYPQKQLLDGKFYQGYTFRDANYYADFPQTVAEVMQMYRKTDSETNFDGVIGVNLKVMEDLLDIVKYVRIGELQFTSGNVFEMLEFSLHNIDYHDVEEVAKRKSILGPLAKALIKETVFSPFKWREVSDMVVKNLNEKHIQLHFFNSSLQNAIHEKGWSGTWPIADGDFLAVVEANLAGMKSDRYIKRDVKYRLQIWEDNESYTLTGKTIIEMEHFGDFNVPISGAYSGYVRVYMPKGSKLKNANVTTHDDSTSEHTVYGTIVKLNPGDRIVIEMEYEVPTSVFTGKKYELDLVKQSGTINDSYSVVVEAPQGTIIDSDDFEGRENYAIWEGNLLRDMELEFNLLPDKLGPRVAYSEMLSLDEILVVFNERIDPASVGKVTIEDMDKASDEHDEIVVKNVRVDFRDMWIEVEGMTEQFEEFYKLTIDSATDIYGNSVKPVPKELTLVQRVE
ncbi:DUF4012 domain-containing protein [Patescibacteria group bacterium]